MSSTGSHQSPGVTELFCVSGSGKQMGRADPALLLGTHAIAGETGRFSQEQRQGVHSPVRASGLGLDRKVSVPCDRQDDVEAAGWKSCLPSRPHVCTHIHALIHAHMHTQYTCMYTHTYMHTDTQIWSVLGCSLVWTLCCKQFSGARFSAQMITKTQVLFAPPTVVPSSPSSLGSLRSCCLRCPPPVPRS